MSNKDIYILGIESSCDDTSAAILKNDKVLSNVIANQDIHKNYGGVVPELASRAHLSNIIPTVESAIKEAKISLDQLSAISFTSFLVSCLNTIISSSLFKNSGANVFFNEISKTLFVPTNVVSARLVGWLRSIPRLAGLPCE